jgi:hypothetical protein
MATKSMGYDNPTYVAVGQDQMGAITVGANIASATKCVAFTALIIKSILGRILVAGTSAATMNLVQISGTTTTTWTGIGGVGSGVTGFSYNTFATASPPILAQGDEYYIQNGTDATITYAASCAERVVQPLANVTQ